MTSHGDIMTNKNIWYYLQQIFVTLIITGLNHHYDCKCISSGSCWVKLLFPSASSDNVNRGKNGLSANIEDMLNAMLFLSSNKPPIPPVQRIDMSKICLPTVCSCCKWEGISLGSSGTFVYIECHTHMINTSFGCLEDILNYYNKRGTSF